MGSVKTVTIERKTPALQAHLPMLCTGVVFLVTGLVFGVQGEWAQTGIAALVLLVVCVPWLVEYWTPARVPASLQIQYALLLIAGPYVGGALCFYVAWPPWDTVVDFYSGFPITVAIITALGVISHVYRLMFPVWFEVTIIIAFKGFVALLWEFGEFFVDQFLGTATQNENFDTMTDMLAGLTPALLLGAALVFYRRKGWFGYIGSLLSVAEPSRNAAHF